MVRWIAATALVLSLAVAPRAFADSQSGPFAQLPTRDSAYHLIRELEQDGYSTGYPRSTFDGSRVLTRYDFAMAVERIYRDLQPRVIAGSDPVTLQRDWNSFQQLLKEFGPDIAALGHDLPDIRQQVEAMRQRLERLTAPAKETSDALARALSQPKPLGVRSALTRPLAERTLKRLVGDKPAFPSVAVDFHRADPINTLDASDMLSIRARVNLDLGGYLFRAFYSRDAGVADPLELRPAAFATTPVRGFGGSVSRNISDSLGISLETATLQSLQDDLQRMVYVKGGLRYSLSNRFLLEVGYELNRWMGMPGDSVDGSAYSIGIRQDFGRDISLKLFWRRDELGHGAFAGGPGTTANTSAITQIGVRF